MERSKQVFIRLPAQSTLMKTVTLSRWLIHLSIAVAMLCVASITFAQADKYKPGDKIEYLESPAKGLWEEGVYVDATPGGKQPIIRKKPNEFYKDGAQTAYDWERIRPLTAKAANKAPAEVSVKTGPAPAPKPAVPEPVKATAPTMPAGTMMTKEEVLNFLQTRLGDQPFANPQREQIKKELAEMIKQRGVNFRYETLSDFSNQLGKYGASSEITFPLQANYGPPTSQNAS